MPAEHPYDYWKAVALAIEAENAKAKIYVAHDASLGTAREAILRRVLVNETPGPYKVKTGLIWAACPEGNREPCVSKQCDLLVYDSHADTPLYRIDDFVVMHYNAAKFIVEV